MVASGVAAQRQRQTKTQRSTRANPEHMAERRPGPQWRRPLHAPKRAPGLAPRLRAAATRDALTCSSASVATRTRPPRELKKTRCHPAAARACSAAASCAQAGADTPMAATGVGDAKGSSSARSARRRAANSRRASTQAMGRPRASTTTQVAAACSSEATAERPPRRRRLAAAAPDPDASVAMSSSHHAPQRVRQPDLGWANPQLPNPCSGASASVHPKASRRSAGSTCTAGEHADGQRGRRPGGCAAVRVQRHGVGAWWWQALSRGPAGGRCVGGWRQGG